jgi:hypothetical protein
MGAAGRVSEAGMSELLHWQTDKLAMIRRITSLEELDGYMTEVTRRGCFPGEMAALMQRRIELQTKR